MRACFSNAGQLCVSTERIYVAEPLMADFARRSWPGPRRCGSAVPWTTTTTSARLINDSQLERVSAHVEDAAGQGGDRARPAVGAVPTSASCSTNRRCSPGSRRRWTAIAEETFGPVVSVYPVADDDEAVARANDSEYGLNASVWTSDPDRGRRVASQIQCGTVNVNEGFAATFGSIDAPMGGHEALGPRPPPGPRGIRRFVEVQSVATQSRACRSPRATG